MKNDRHKLVRFLKDLRRRRVVQVAAAYILGSWVIIEAASVVLPAFEAPNWALRATIVVFVAAFPVALILSWYFDITPEGIVETEPMDPADEQPDAESPEQGDEPPSFAERRSVTVLRYSIDIHDEDGDDVDPETLRDVLPSLHKSCAEVIQRFGGHLAWEKQSEAEVYFGYPLAVEHDARSAVRCALSLVATIARDSDDESVASDISVGICSGVTVTESAAPTDAGDVAPVTGKALTWAARLLDMAPPGRVVISESTRALLGEDFECEPTSGDTSAAADGRSWFVLSEHSTVYDATQRRQPAQLLGRESELKLLEDLWQQAKQDRGQTIAIVGDPGYGKSALASLMIHNVAEDTGSAVAVCQCSYLNRDVALYPVAELYRRSIIGLDRVDSPEQRVALIESFLSERNLDLERHVPLLADLLHVSPTPNYPPLELEPQAIKDQTLEFIIDSLFHRAAEQPVLLVIEDLHWSDATTRELLGRIIRRGPESQLCTLLTYRPEFEAPWAGSSTVAQLNLRALTRDQARAFVTNVAGGAVMPETLCERIIDQSDGVPLFLEELTKAVIDSANQFDADQIEAVPATLQETLMARLDRLGQAKRVAQIASVFGREFDYEWMAGLAEFDGETLDEALAALVASELLYQKGAPPGARYFFKHVLIQEAAYESLLKRDRRQYHGRISRLLEEEFNEWRLRNPQVVAAHWAAAGEPAKSAALYLEAGSHALHRSAYDEAERQCRAALEQLKSDEPTAVSKKLELEVSVALGQAMTPTRGFFSKAVESVYERARELSVELGEAETNYRISTGLWRTKIAQGRLLEAQKHAEETRAIAEAGGSDVSLIGSMTLLGITDFHLGHIVRAEQRLERVVELYGSEPRDGLADIFGQDPCVTALGWYAISRWLRGHSRESNDAIAKAIDLSRRLDHSFTLAYTLRQSLLLHYFRHELDEMSSTVDELDELARTNGFAEMNLYVAFWRLVLKAFEPEPGDSLTGIAQIVEQCRATGVALNLPYIRGILADLYLAARELDACADTLEAAMGEASRLHIRWYLAELYRLQGRLLTERKDGPEGSAESSFDQALDVSVQQDNVYFGLRTRLDLARMYFGANNTRQAADVLTKIDEIGIDPGNLPELSEKNRLEQQLHA